MYYFVVVQNGHKVTYPIAADPKREIIKQLNMVDPDEKDDSGNDVPSRALHIVGPDKKVIYIHTYIIIIIIIIS